MEGSQNKLQESAVGPNLDWEDSESNPIRVEKLSEIKDHVGESYETKKIHVSRERIQSFVDAVGDINPIHFDENRTGESIYGDTAEGRIFVPGFLTQSLCVNKDGVYSALLINEPHEILLRFDEARFKAPVFAGSDISYKLQIEHAKDLAIKGRKSVEVVWGVTASAWDGYKKYECLKAKCTLIYASLNATE